jgi:hypothetical protein
MDYRPKNSFSMSYASRKVIFPGEDQNLMTLYWCLLLEWGMEHVAFSFVYKASQYVMYEWPQTIATQNKYDARSKIIDAALTLILPEAYPRYVII